MQAFELTILNWIQAHLRCGVLDAVMVPVSRICDHGEVWILLAAILLAIPKTRKLGTCVACGLALDLLFCNLALKPLIGRVRPFAVNPTVSLLIPPPVDASFPSGHTAASFASVAALKTANSRLWKPALALAVVIALSRLYLYAHWPTDILGAPPWALWQAGWERSWHSHSPEKKCKKARKHLTCFRVSVSKKSFLPAEQVFRTS